MTTSCSRRAAVGAMARRSHLLRWSGSGEVQVEGESVKLGQFDAAERLADLVHGESLFGREARSSANRNCAGRDRPGPERAQVAVSHVRVGVKFGAHLVFALCDGREGELPKGLAAPPRRQGRRHPFVEFDVEEHDVSNQAAIASAEGRRCDRGDGTGAAGRGGGRLHG